MVMANGSSAMAGIAYHKPHYPNLQKRLCHILSIPQPGLLVGIPNMGKDASPVVMRNHWNKYRRKPEVLQLLNPNTEYASSTITRPDSIPGINTAEYWELFRSVWEGRDVVYIHGGKKNIRPQHLTNAASVREVITPNYNAWLERHRIFGEARTISFRFKRPDCRHVLRAYSNGPRG